MKNSNNSQNQPPPPGPTSRSKSIQPGNIKAWFNSRSSKIIASCLTSGPRPILFRCRSLSPVVLWRDEQSLSIPLQNINQMLKWKAIKRSLWSVTGTEPDDFDDDDDAYDDNIELAVAVKEVNKNIWSIDYEQMVKIVQKSNWHEVNIENASSSFTRNLKRNETNLLSSIWKRLCEDFYTRNFICCVSICVRMMETLSLLFLQWSPLYNTTQCNPTNIWLLLINIERQLFFKFIQLTYTYI